ncbi:MAPEG family protein [Derxia gummosa]|uniref:MAPEG family protein n=1 Tax=Derxia gummosa DSM 723 TaxID=1121388 RepID=A0A8B6X606_9BURK|nr:MAPEG family protein [Derxia gummosa]
MKLSIFCIVIAAFLPLVCAWLAKSGGFRDMSFDNHAPREWLAKLQGRPARAQAAQANSWEAFPVFAAGVLAAQFLGVPQGRIDLLALAHLLARLVYIACYVGDRPTARSTAWAVGFGCSIALYFAALW